MTNQSQSARKLAKYKRNRHLGIVLRLMPVVVIFAFCIILVPIVGIVGLSIALLLGWMTTLRPFYAQKSILATRTYLAELQPNQTAGQSSRLDGLLLAKLIWQKDNQRIYDLQTEHSDIWSLGVGYSTIYESQLQRRLPHIVFIKHILPSSNNWLNSSGGYQSDKEIVIDELTGSFRTFAPVGSKLDVYSFITPEVIEVILSLKDLCSKIEIIDNQLFCISKFLDKDRLAIFQAQTQNLFLKLNDNLDTRRNAHQLVATADLSQPRQITYQYLLWPVFIFGTQFAIILLVTLRSIFDDQQHFSASLGVGTALALIILGAIPGFCLYLFFKRRRMSKQAVTAAKK